MAFITLNGIKIFYEVRGSGDTILLLHNGFASTKMWEKVYPSLVEAGYRVVMYDRRGYGQSEEGTDFEGFYVSGVFRDESVKELATLMGALEIDSFHIVGQCEGGVVGIDYAVAYPEHARTITAACTQCYSTVSMPEFNRLKFSKAFHELKPKHRNNLVYWHGEDRAEGFYNLFRTYGGAYGIGFFDLRDLLPKVTCPALVLYPDRSFLFDVEQAVTFYRHLPNGELAVLPRCGHNFYEYEPEEYARFVLNFLKRHDF